MSWAIGYDTNWRRDIGYGVPAQCDHPDCTAEIHRGLAYVCGGEPYGGEHGCGLHFCTAHLRYADAPAQQCEQCAGGGEPFTPSPDAPEWLSHKLTDPCWREWRETHVDEVQQITTQLTAIRPTED